MALFCKCISKFIIMDSINAQQEEKNHEDLQGNDAFGKIKELVEKAKNCFFCTQLQTGKAFETRPMAIQKIDDNGILWFLSSSDSHKNKQILIDPNVQLLFQGADYSKFLTLYGKATINTDKDKIKELWEPILKTWFTGGVDDPRITVIRVEPQDGYYWDTKHGQVVALLKQVAGAITGKTLDDSIEGRLDI